MLKVFMFLLLNIVITKSEHGRQDLFSSLAQLEALWHNDIEVVQHMKEAIAKMEIALATLKVYVQQHHKHGLNQTPNYDYLGHPINAYHLIRHVASGWQNVKKSVINEEIYSLVHDLDTLKNREIDDNLPDKSDIEGSIDGLLRLWSQYRYNITEFVRNGKIVATLKNGNSIKSEASVLRLNSFDLERLAYTGENNRHYDVAVLFFEQLIQVSSKEIEQGMTDFHHLFDHQIKVKNYNNILSRIKKLHDEILDKHGQYWGNARCNKHPFVESTKKKKRKHKKYNATIILDRSKAKYYFSAMRNDSDVEIRDIATRTQADALCRGGKLKTAHELAQLRCFYADSNSDWLHLSPMKIQINSYDPVHATIIQLLYDDECNAITKYLGPKLDFPPGKMKASSKRSDWTMKNSWPNEDSHNNFRKLNRRIEHVTGLLADSSKKYSEPFMCGNYGIGGYYGTHPDYFSDENANGFSETGNRVATILTIFSSPEAGGGTVWPYAGISMFPEKGSSLFWYNTFTDSDPDILTQHAACPVLLGNKWIGNKWVGYNAQWNKKKCDLFPSTPFKVMTPRI